ncbi:hypothetical protein BJV77DRAFT_1045378, partial [Russula vinacea]
TGTRDDEAVVLAGSLHARVRAQPDGRLENTPDAHNPEGFSTFFPETSSGKHVPWSLYIDLEPNIVDRCTRSLYNRKGTDRQC